MEIYDNAKFKMNLKNFSNDIFNLFNKFFTFESSCIVQNDFKVDEEDKEDMTKLYFMMKYYVPVTILNLFNYITIFKNYVDELEIILRYFCTHDLSELKDYEDTLSKEIIDNWTFLVNLYKEKNCG